MAPANKTTKQMTDTKYRQKKKAQNPEAYAAHRREITKRSYEKRKVEMTEREKRMRRRRRT
jgi:hypothetical protein